MDLLNLLSNVWHEKSHSPMKYNSAQTQKYQILEFPHEFPIEKVEVGQLQDRVHSVVLLWATKWEHRRFPDKYTPGMF